MWTFLKLALRNLRKNSRRSFYTIAAVATGSCALSLYVGYADKVYLGLEISAVHGEALGHLTVAKKGFFEEGRIDPEKYLFSASELLTILTQLRALKSIVAATPRLSFSGLASNGKISTIFLAQGEDPQDSAKIRWSGWSSRKRLLDGSKPNSGTLGEDLGKLLSAKSGSTVALLTSTMDGQVNALDLEVMGLVNTGSLATNDKFMLTSLRFAQTLLDTQGADRIVVLCTDDVTLEKCRAAVDNALKPMGVSEEIRSWIDLSNSYKPVKAMFDVILWFLAAIVIVVVFMAVVNTMSTSVFERFREIGTMRAIGMPRESVIKIFSLEGGLLGLIGSLVGCVLAIAIASGLNAANLSYVSPNASRLIPFSISILPWFYFVVTACNVSLSVVASLLPSFHATKMEIVDVLGHV